MPWKIVERKLGRAGSAKQRANRQRQWDRQYGADTWAVGYVLDGQFVLQEEALESVYYRSYEVHFEEHPEDLEELIALAKVLRNPHAEATTGVDLQVPAVMKSLNRRGLALQARTWSISALGRRTFTRHQRSAESVANSLCRRSETDTRRVLAEQEMLGRLVRGVGLHRGIPLPTIAIGM